MNNTERNLTLAKLINPMLDGTLVPDYCNNWNDLMPLVVEHEIDLYKCVDGAWEAQIIDMTSFNSPCDKTICAKHKNPQRALAECLLQVLESKQQDNLDAAQHDRRD